MTGFQDFNFFIGPNNAGKSIVLNFLTHHLNPRAARVEPNVIEAFHGKSFTDFRAQIGIPYDIFLSNILKKPNDGEELSIFSDIKNIVENIKSDDFVWYTIIEHADRVRILDNQNRNDLISQEVWKRVWSFQNFIKLDDVSWDTAPDTMDWFLSSQNDTMPPVFLIPAKRQIGPSDEESKDSNDLSGRGLIKKLAKLQNPDYSTYEHDKHKFNRINEFLQFTTGSTDATIEIPRTENVMLVRIKGKTLPLESLGTGIHEVVMIAAFSTIHENCIMCIEEPEIHLHPILQRKLVRYLRKNTNNQYFIATHSAAFIDTPDAAIFHVSNDGSQTYIRGTQLDSEKFQVCVDLGYKASDILQSNAVVWVEGPSDRIYLKKWIETLDAELVEGLHYSIMFYGGRLLSHLSGEPEALEDFIQLRSLNRNSAIVIDSDKKGPGAAINSTKERLQEEFSKDGGLAWITRGREIENYVDHKVLQAAVQELNASAYDKPSDGGQYDHALYFLRKEPRSGAKNTKDEDPRLEKTIDKVSVAHLLCEGDLSLNVLDLKEQATALVNFIRKANHLGSLQG